MDIVHPTALDCRAPLGSSDNVGQSVLAVSLGTAISGRVAPAQGAMRHVASGYLGGLLGAHARLIAEPTIIISSSVDADAGRRSQSP